MLAITSNERPSNFNEFITVVSLRNSNSKIPLIEKFIDDIINTTKSLVVVKKINLEAAIEQLPELINIDYVMFKRALVLV